jgi:hypothetical protein
VRHFINICSETLDAFDIESSVMLSLIYDSIQEIKIRSQCVAHNVSLSLFFRS